MNPLFRRINLADLSALAQLVAAGETVDEEISRPVEIIRAELVAAIDALTHAGWLALTETGEIIGYNYVEVVIGTNGVNFWLRGLVHPAWRGRGLGQELLQHSWGDLLQFRAGMTDRLAEVNAWAYRHDTARCRLFERFGLQPDHIYYELTLPADQVGSVPSLPPDMVIRPWEDRYCEAVATLRNRAFAQSWGYQPTTTEALRRRFQMARYEPSLSFTAWHVAGSGEELVGLVHACLGQTGQVNRGEIVWLAVADAWRGQGLGQALMLTVMRALGQAGANLIHLSADHYANQANIGLFTRLGFAVRKVVVDYRGLL